MLIKSSSKLLCLLLLLAITISTFSPVLYADNIDKSVPINTDYKGHTFIRSDGSVWVLSGQQLIPTQVAGVTDAVEVLADRFVLTAAGKTYALQEENKIIKPIEIITDAKIVKIKGNYLIDINGQVYYYLIYYGENVNYDVEKFNEFKLPFQVQDMNLNYYSDKNVYLFLTTEGKVWIRDNVNRQLLEIGQENIRYTSIYDNVVLDENGMIWSVNIDSNAQTNNFLTPVESTNKIKQISAMIGTSLAIFEDQSAMLFTETGWIPFRTVNNKKVLQIAGTNGNYYYLTADHMLYYKSMDKSTLIAENVASFYIDHNFQAFIYQKLDRTLGTWPSTTVQIKNERVEWNLTNPAAYDLQPPIPVKVNGETIGMPKGAWLINNTTYLPLRSIFTQLGAKVSWDNTNKVASLSANINGQAKSITVDYTKQKLFVNGVPIPLNQELFIADGSAYLPLRLVSEGLGAKVDWDQETKEIHITSVE